MVPTSERDTPTYQLSNFYRKMHEDERNWIERGVRPCSSIRLKLFSHPATAHKRHLSLRSVIYHFHTATSSCIDQADGFLIGVTISTVRFSNTIEQTAGKFDTQSHFRVWMVSPYAFRYGSTETLASERQIAPSSCMSTSRNCVMTTLHLGRDDSREL